MLQQPVINVTRQKIRYEIKIIEIHLRMEVIFKGINYNRFYLNNPVTTHYDV